MNNKKCSAYLLLWGRHGSEEENKGNDKTIRRRTISSSFPSQSRLPCPADKVNHVANQ